MSPVLDFLPETMREDKCILKPDTFAKQVNACPSLSAYRLAAWEEFQSLPWPTKKDERWRFGNPKAVDPSGYSLGDAPVDVTTDAIIARSSLIEDTTSRIIFADGHLVSCESLPEDLLSKGVCLLTLEEVFEKHPALVQKHFPSSLEALGSQKWSLLGRAYAQSGVFLYVPKGVQIEKPIAIYHWAVAPHALITPYSWVVADEGSHVRFVEVYESLTTQAPCFAICQNQTSIGLRAEVFRKTLQLFNQVSLSVQIDNCHLKQEAHFNSISIQLGSSYGRFENQAFVEGENAHVKLASLSVSNQEQTLDQRSLQVHKSPSATSDLLYKNALMDKSQTIFSGMIVVEPGAQKTDAYQTNRNLLLSGEAEAIALPGLEIEANDVKCSHGATTSPVDESEIFYLQSRGIRRKDAEGLLVQGFFEEVIDRIQEPSLAQNVRQVVQAKLEKR